MTINKFSDSITKITLAGIVIIVGVVLKKYGDISFTSIEEKQTNYVVLTQEQLSQYNGNSNDILYLAVLGHIFDVTDGGKYYAPGSSYNYFTGKDGTRALVTGNFKDESPLKDHVLDLTCNDLLTLLRWRQTFRKKYKFIGILNGRYYDKWGKETKYLSEVKSRLKQCEIEKANVEKENIKYPPCNIAWSAEEGSQVWCTKTSGGVERNWVGVPRRLFTPGEEKPRCVCINPDNDNISTNLLKVYDNCHDSSTSCVIANN